jgi:protocatechuate 3,4-dioxygenase alpha subunit
MGVIGPAPAGDGRLIFETTPSQTVGPYFAIGLPFDGGANVVPEGTPGSIRITGTVFDGDGVPIPDYLIETWQADPAGRFVDLHQHGEPSQLPGFRGFGRCGYEVGDGTYEILTVKPGPVPGPGTTTQAPHIAVSLFARGLLHRCVTRIYFGDEAERNAVDPVLCSISPARRRTLIAAPTADGFRFDIRVQGADETVFFAL